MKAKLISSIVFLLGLMTVQAQPFRIVAQYPVRVFVTPAGTAIVAPICVSTPVVPATYQVQISTNRGTIGPWVTRFAVTENNAGTNCWNIPLQASETNRFFLRAVRL